MIDALKEENYVMAFTFGQGKEHRKATRKDDKYQIPRLNISNDMPMWKFKLRIVLPKKKHQKVFFLFKLSYCFVRFVAKLCFKGAVKSWVVTKTAIKVNFGWFFALFY